MTEGPPLMQRIRVVVHFHDGTKREVLPVSPGINTETGQPAAAIQYQPGFVLIHTARGGHESFPERSMKWLECIATGLAVPAGVQ